MPIEFVIGWPQLVYMISALIGLGISAVKHGQYRDGTYNFWISLVATMFVLSVLYWGGFFS